MAHRGHCDYSDVFWANLRCSWRWFGSHLSPSLGRDCSSGGVDGGGALGALLASHRLVEYQGGGDAQVAWEFHHDSGNDPEGWHSRLASVLCRNTLQKPVRVYRGGVAAGGQPCQKVQTGARPTVACSYQGRW